MHTYVYFLIDFFYKFKVCDNLVLLKFPAVIFPQYKLTFCLCAMT